MEFPLFTILEKKNIIFYRAIFANGKTMNFQKSYYKDRLIHFKPTSISFFFGQDYNVATGGAIDENYIKNFIHNTGEKEISFKQFIEAINIDFVGELQQFFEDTGLNIIKESQEIKEEQEKLPF